MGCNAMSPGTLHAPDCLTPKMAALHSSKTPVTIYQFTKCSIPQDMSHHHRCCKNLKS